MSGLSVVVIGRNEGARLVRCLESISRARLPEPHEVVYVDSASTDGSPERAAELGAHVLRVQPERPSAAVGRNAGWRAALFDHILFLDGDTVLDPDFVARAWPVLDAPCVAIVWGHRRELHPEASVYNRVLDLDWIYRPGPTEFCGGDALVRRAALEEVDGFDDTLIAGEEPELCRRLRARGWIIDHVDVPMTLHDLDIHRFRQYWRRAYRAGRAYAEVSARYRYTAEPFWDGEARANLRNGAVLLATLPVGVLLSILLRSALPLGAAALFLVVLCLRAAWRTRWKTRALATLLLHGVHSHLQQIPIFVGQLAWHRDRRTGRRAGLVEYKGPS